MSARHTNFSASAFAVAAGLVLSVSTAQAHCDSLDGPVILTAKAALEKGDPTPVLKWVRRADEREIKDAFSQTLKVRANGPEARELADRYFFETLVRIHRAGEGFPYAGLKASVKDAGPAVVGADEALEIGSVDALATLLTGETGQGLRRRFAHAKELKAHAGDSLEAGRQYVAAYVDYVHYAEGIYQAAAKAAGHHGEAAHEQPSSAKPASGGAHGH